MAPLPTPICARRVVERELARGRAEQVLPAQHVGDLHEQVVDGRDQRVERGPAGAAEREVGDELGLEGDLAADQVVEGDLALGHPEPDDRLAVLGAEGLDLLVGQLAAEPVVPHHLGAGGLAPRLDLVGGAVAVVGELALAQPREDVGVDVRALRLAVRAERATLERALVPVEAEPLHDLDQALVGLLGVAGGVGVLDAEDERAAVVAGERPVVEGRPGQADVRAAGRGRGHPDADGPVGGRSVSTSFNAVPPCS